MTLTAPCLMDIKPVLCLYNRMKNPYKTGLLFLAAFFLLCACGRSGYAGGSAPYELASRSYEAPASSAPMSIEAASYTGSAAESSADNFLTGEAVQTRKLVKRAQLQIRVDDPEASEKPLMDLLDKYNAWTASTRINQNARNYSIRVPSSFYDNMVAELKNLGKIINHSENAEDVTLRYYDLESRLAVRQELLETYKGYLAKAANIDEIMTVESRIADLQWEIDQTGTQFRNLANLVDYSTINVDIQGPSNASNSKLDLKDELGGLFGSFGEVLSMGLVILVGIIIYGVPAILIVVLLFWVLFGRIGLLKKLWRIAAGKR